MIHNTQLEKDIHTLTKYSTQILNFNAIISRYSYDFDKLIIIIRSYRIARCNDAYEKIIKYLTHFDNNTIFDSFDIKNIIEIFSTMVNMYHKVNKNPNDLFDYNVLNYNNLVCRKDIIKFFKKFSKFIDFSSYKYGHKRIEICEDICLYGTINLLNFFETHNLKIPLEWYSDFLLEKSYYNYKDSRIFDEILKRIKMYNINLFIYNFNFLKKKQFFKRHIIKKIKNLIKYNINSTEIILNILINDINYLRTEQLVEILDNYDFKIKKLTKYDICNINFIKLSNNILFEKLLNKIDNYIIKETFKLEYIYYFINKNDLLINNNCLKIINKYLGNNNKLLANKMFNRLFSSFIYYNQININHIEEILNFIHRLNEYKQDYIITELMYNINYEVFTKLFFCGIDILKLLKNTIYNCNTVYKNNFYNDIVICLKNNKILKYINTQRVLKRIIYKIRNKHKYTFSKILTNIAKPQEVQLIKNKRTIPINLKPLNIIELLLQEQITVSPKADGIYESINLSLYYPYINLMKIRRINFESELIKIRNMNINLVFGNHDLIMLLRQNFNFIETNNYIANSNLQLKAIMEKEKESFKNFIETNMDKTENLWYPKISVKINYNIRLDYLEKYKNSCYFDTDGWIINDNFKLKHREHMTIDLKNTEFGFKDSEENVYNNVKNINIFDDKIYRCYFNGLWEPRELRQDKNYPNSRKVIENIINYHEGHWDYEYVQNLYDRYFKVNINNYYYGKNKRCNFKHLIPKYHKTINKYLTNNKSIIDLCCGYSGYFYRSKLKIKKYIGFDINMKVKEHLFNINTNWNSLYNLFYGKNLEKYDIILCNNAIQNVSNLEHFCRNINEISYKGTRLIIRFLDWDLMKKMNEASYNENYVRIIDNKKIKYYYGHSHNESIIEQVYSLNDILESLKNEWNLEFINEYKQDNKHCDFQKYLYFFKIAVFVKI